MTDAVRIAAHAKINLFLRILARESSGFHQIETAFALLELADELHVRRTDSGVTLEVNGPDLGPADENLAVRAARAVLDATGNRFGVAITLRKRIPVRAGLGGGSSDGAAALLAVNALAGDAVPRHELLHFAARLGADVAFCASGAPPPSRGVGASGYSGSRRRPPHRRSSPSLLRPSPWPRPTLTAGGTTCISSRRRGGRSSSTPPRSRPGAASAGWGATTSRCRCSGSTPDCAPCTRSWRRRTRTGCGCAARAGPWPPCTRASGCATTPR